MSQNAQNRVLFVRQNNDDKQHSSQGVQIKYSDKKNKATLKV